MIKDKRMIKAYFIIIVLLVAIGVYLGVGYSLYMMFDVWGLVTWTLFLPCLFIVFLMIYTNLD